MERNQLKCIIEAALLASSHPLTLPQISGLFDELEMPPHDDLARALSDLQDDCAERGIELVEVASGFRYQVRQDVHAFISRLWSERPSRYSRALLETLSLIAYRQPITRAEIEQIRGVAVSTNIVRTLEEREWVRVVGYRDLPGKPALFGTTKQFLDYFNLKSLDELPSLSELRDFEEADPQLEFDADRRVIAAAVGLPDDEEATEELEEPDDPIDASSIDEGETSRVPAVHESATPDLPHAIVEDDEPSSSLSDAGSTAGDAEKDIPESAV
ncbi:MAG: SMC-Scp complex subunit ScpB [Dokdonella sp.]|uniref:SMC-Scp complex subunit ScpB n=1 Tax=Dokdonella sp. TaxID=2291710 RepID=UPI0032636D6A